MAVAAPPLEEAQRGSQQPSAPQPNQASLDVASPQTPSVVAGDGAADGLSRLELHGAARDGATSAHTIAATKPQPPVASSSAPGLASKSSRASRDSLGAPSIKGAIDRSASAPSGARASSRSSNAAADDDDDDDDDEEEEEEGGGGAFTPLRGSTSTASATVNGGGAAATSRSRHSGASAASTSSSRLPPLKVRDFAFSEEDPRHLGARYVGPATADGDGYGGDELGGSASRDGAAAGGASGVGWMGPPGWRSVHGRGLEDDDDGELDGFGWGASSAAVVDVDGVGVDGVAELGEYDDDEYDEYDVEGDARATDGRGNAGGGGGDGDGDGDGVQGLRLGIYRAAFEFEAESEHELTIRVGSRLRVVGALEGGWAIAEVVEDAADEAAAASPSTTTTANAQQGKGVVAGKEEEKRVSGSERPGGREPKRGLVPETYLEWLGEEQPDGVVAADGDGGARANGDQGAAADAAMGSDGATTKKTTTTTTTTTTTASAKRTSASAVAAHVEAQA